MTLVVKKEFFHQPPKGNFTLSVDSKQTKNATHNYISTDTPLNKKTMCFIQTDLL